MTARRPPYGVAALTAIAVLAGYLVTLAPTVTFWDAGEFITAAKSLGIPHPPGTPLFVLISHVWAMIVPIGAYAWRTNLLSAVCGALAAGCWCLVAHDVIGRMHADVDPRERNLFASLGGAAAGLLTGFGFTAWQNSNETEVYATATLGIALVAWIATRWRATRGHGERPMLLLAALYPGALSAGNHPLGLLAGPALIVFLVVTARTEPLLDLNGQRREWARIVVIGAAWVLVIGLALGDPRLAAAGLGLVAIAIVRAHRVRQLPFALIAIVLVVVGISTLAFLQLRANQHPWLDQGTPSTWHGVLDVIRRAQYAPRTPFDDPTVLHGPGNPGRTVTLLAYQMANYAQYFDWQWAAGIGTLSRSSPLRLVFTLLMATIGIRGAFAQRRADAPSFALVATLFAVTGPVLLLYLNFKPGPSIGWDRWTRGVDHEVRDRDYFFVASFVAWGVWVALGLVDLARRWIPQVAVPRRKWVTGIFAIALLPVMLNFSAATRRQTPERTFARDFAHALLASAPPNAVLFTWGDNDTFPLWYAQQVEGFRPDVTVVCLALAQAPWYVKLIRDQPHINAVREQMTPVWRDAIMTPVTRPLHGIDDARIDAFRPFRTGTDLTLDLGVRGVARIPAGGIVTPADITVSEVMRMNAGHRPIAWSITAADALYGLGPRLVQSGLALVMPVSRPDSSRLVGGAASGPGGALLDLEATRRLIDESWSFGALEIEGAGRLDANIQAVAGTLVAPMVQVARALLLRGDTVAATRMLDRAIRIADDSTAQAVRGQLRH